MGNVTNCGTSSQSQDMGDFNPASYFKPGMTINEIVGIKTIFESLKPQDGFVRVEKIQELYKSSYDKPKIDQMFGSRKYVNFEEFYEIMSYNIIEKKKRFKNIEFDSGEDPVMPFCIICPYPVHKTNEIDTA